MSKRTRAAALGAATTALAAGLGAYPVFFRRWCLTWGARPDEVSRKLPGDELLPRAGIVATRAITIDAPPAAIWPWLERKMLLGIKERAENLAREQVGGVAR
jgi:hypothetical protein